MRTRILATLILISSAGNVSSQTSDSIKVVISHIFFCVDSGTYQNLFNSDLLVNQFAYSSESSSQTTTDSWTGKYLMGQQSYIEVFAANQTKAHPELGDKFGDAGIVFRTTKPGDIYKIDTRMKSDKKDSLELMKYESDGKTIPFNYNLYVTNAALQESFRPYVEEFTTEFLTICGFSETEIDKGITAKQFGEKRRGRKYEKLFDNIQKIELTLTDEELDYLAESLKYFGFSRSVNRFFNGKLEIVCSVQQNRKYKLKAIHFALLNNTEDAEVEISNNLTFKASGKEASFEFNY